MTVPPIGQRRLSPPAQARCACCANSMAGRPRRATMARTKRKVHGSPCWMPTKLERQLLYDVSADIAIIHCQIDRPKFGMPAEINFEHLWQQNWIANSA